MQDNIFEDNDFGLRKVVYIIRARQDLLEVLNKYPGWTAFFAPPSFGQLHEHGMNF